MMDPATSVHPDAAIAPGYLVNHAARLFNHRVDATLRPHGLTMALVGPLLLLSWKGSLLQRDLVRSSAVKQPTMVMLLDKLEAMELVVRTPVPADRRASMVALTEAGADAARIGGDALLDANRCGMVGFSAEEASRLVALLQRMIDNLEDSR